jgi:adenine-specific DNA-methyltransferase
MSRLSDLLRTAGQLDPQLAKDLEAEIQPLQRRLPFGLNFERHAPEAVELAGHKVRKGSKVRVLPPRGSTARGDQRLWRVMSVKGDHAVITTPNGDEEETVTTLLDDLILVAEFRDRIYPGLRPDGEVSQGGDKPFHTVINGENFHVLEQLTFTHEGSVDAIYIDPPYNTGSRDWKYNNDYVEGDDLYRHSKWLAFMERRLRVAKRLLKPDDSVLIVTIDEKEYLRLGLLLEQTFPEADIQMITSVINPKGSARQGRFSRTDEYIYFVMFGDSYVEPWKTDMIRDAPSEGASVDVRWAGLLRNGEGSLRSRIPSMFYPIFLDAKTGALHSVGEPPARSTPRESVDVPDGTVAVWPVDGSGRELMWRLNPASLRQYLADGYAKFGRRDPVTGRRSPSYLQSGVLAKIKSGDAVVSGYDDDGAAKIAYLPGKRTAQPMTLWNRTSHSASEHGASFIKAFLPGRKFPYPKSLYAVEDALRFFLVDKPDAVVLDFFAGSGTTAHAVMRLNRQDIGRRQAILVTNNEVSADEQRSLRASGLRPGDDEWEKFGICDFVTKPRIRAAITGKSHDGEPIKGEYRFTDEFPMSEGFAENAAFFTLTYESPFMVSTDRAFAAIAPTLWLRAGARGGRIDSVEGGWAVADSYGILRDLDQSAEFLEALKKQTGIRVVYIVTDDEGRYQQVASELPLIETVRLYEDYLRNCESTGDL